MAPFRGFPLTTSYTGVRIDPRPLYIMYITRPAFYDRLIREIENRPALRPVYTIKKWNGTLLKIYHNRLMADTKS